MVGETVLDKPLLKPDKLCGDPVRGIECPYIITGLNIGGFVYHAAGGMDFKIKIISDGHVHGKRAGRCLGRRIVDGNLNIFRPGTAHFLGAADAGKHFGSN